MLYFLHLIYQIVNSSFDVITVAIDHTYIIAQNIGTGVEYFKLSFDSSDNNLLNKYQGFFVLAFFSDSFKFIDLLHLFYHHRSNSSSLAGTQIYKILIDLMMMVSGKQDNFYDFHNITCVNINRFKDKSWSNEFES